MNNDDHDKIIEIHTDLKYVKKSVDNLLKGIAISNSRINDIEGWKDKVNGAFAVVGIVLGLIGAKITKLF